MNPAFLSMSEINYKVLHIQLFDPLFIHKNKMMIYT